jgi:hypothetical protein
MDLRELFKLKYDLLENLQVKSFENEQEQSAYLKGYEEAVNAFFVETMARLLEPESTKKAS